MYIKWTHIQIHIEIQTQVMLPINKWINEKINVIWFWFAQCVQSSSADEVRHSVSSITCDGRTQLTCPLFRELVQPNITSSKQTQTKNTKANIISIYCVLWWSVSYVTVLWWYSNDWARFLIPSYVPFIRSKDINNVTVKGTSLAIANNLLFCSILFLVASWNLWCKPTKRCIHR